MFDEKSAAIWITSIVCKCCSTKSCFTFLLGRRIIFTRIYFINFGVCVLCSNNKSETSFWFGRCWMPSEEKNIFLFYEVQPLTSLQSLSAVVHSTLDDSGISIKSLFNDDVFFFCCCRSADCDLSRLPAAPFPDADNALRLTKSSATRFSWIRSKVLKEEKESRITSRLSPAAWEMFRTGAQWRWWFNKKVLR